MRLTYFAPVLLLFSVLVLSSCDSPSDTKASGVINPPSPMYPSDQDTSVSLTPTFQWNGAADRLEVAKTSEFNNGFKTSVSGNSFTMPSGVLERGTYYFWHVGTTQNGTIFWSEKIFSFRTTN